jgi:excisionase family DNA binding protein
MMPTPAFFTVDEMAALLGVSHKTIYRRLEDGLIRRAPLGGRLIRIPASELDRLDGIGTGTPSTENPKF